MVRNTVSCFFVSSLHMVARRSPSVSDSSSRVFIRWWGASYRMMVRVSFFKTSRIFFLSFLSVGRNASKANRLVASPDTVSAVIHAQAPGSDVTVIPASCAIFTSSSPGSEMAGVPASVISAMFCPSSSFSMRVCPLSILLYS